MFNFIKFLLDEKGFLFQTIENTKNYPQYASLIVKRTKILAFKYPKLIIFTICVIFSLFLFQNETFTEIVTHLGNLEYLGVFIAGALFSFGFTTPFATAVFVKLNVSNIFLSTIIAGIGASLTDLIIFKFVKFSFEEEFKKLKKERPFLFIKKNINSNLSKSNINFLSIAFAGILLASPLPDEAGIAILAGISKMSYKKLAIISFVCKTIGILILLIV